MEGGGRLLHLPRRTAPHVISLDDVERSEERIMRYLRHTPLMQTWLRCRDGKRVRVSLKLENLQITENFTVRGMLNAALSLPAQQLARGLVGYGLMHGPAAAYVAHVLSVPSVVYMYPSAATDEQVRT